MLHFENDYLCGAHPRILERFLSTNLDPQSGYGEDEYSLHAAQLIKEACGLPEADVFFLAGGTQANSVIISSLLESYEGVVAASTGHINVHEAGAIEYGGHKVMALPSHEGKIDPAELEQLLERFYGDETREHMVWPGMVYLSYPSEYGTLYTREELQQIRCSCSARGIKVFVDGARLGYGLASPACDMTLPEFARLCDVFYIGGTKVGALCGEAVVFSGMQTPAHFVTRIKQRGALLAKGRLAGIQFETLFSKGAGDELLYMECGRHAISMAQRMIGILKEKGYTFALETPTNQQFLLLTDEEYSSLKEKVTVSFWEKPDEEHTVVRMATSWSTTEEDLAALEECL